MLQEKNSLNRQSSNLVSDIETTLATVKNYWVQRSLAMQKIKLQQVLCSDILSEDFGPHPLSPFDTSVCSSSNSWRKLLERPAHEALPLRELKDVFDVYFRDDLYGDYKDINTVHLSRGIHDPRWYPPPAAISQALESSILHGHFGYSDTLGHDEVRENVTFMEQIRRPKLKLDRSNISIIPGGTLGLHAVLYILSRTKRRGRILVMAPTYAPIVDAVEMSVGVDVFQLNYDYSVDFEKLCKKIRDDDIRGILLSSPHNPFCANEVDIYTRLIEFVQELGKFCILDEVLFSNVSPNINDLRQVFIVCSWSKRYYVPGLKIGHLLAEQSLIQDYYRYASTIYGSTPSFMYLACSVASSLERTRLAGTKLELPELAANSEETKDLELEFNLWANTEEIIQKFVIMKLLEAISRHARDGIVEVLSSNSINIVLRTQLTGPTYRTFLAILEKRNISVFPLDAMVCKDDRHDLRLSLGIEPRLVGPSLISLVETLNQLYLETRAVRAFY